MKNQYRFIDPPAPLRPAKLDNVALVPGNLLPYIKRWHQLAGELAKDELVIVIPENDTKQKKTLTTVALLHRDAGHHVKVVHEAELSPPPGGAIAL
jgi:hypothetical protein